MALTLRSLENSSVEISYGQVLQSLRRDLAQQLLQRTSQGDLAHDLLQRSSHDLAESYLVPHRLEATLNAHHVFTTRVALVLLAYSH